MPFDKLLIDWLAILGIFMLYKDIIVVIIESSDTC